MAGKRSRMDTTATEMNKDWENQRMQKKKWGMRY